MSTTYSFSKTIKNIIPLVQQIQSLLAVSGTTTTLTNYVPSVGNVSFNFSTALSSALQLALNTCVNSYYDQTVLTANDMITNKSMRAYLVNNVTITAGSVINYTPFSSTSTIDRLYFQMSYSNQYIYIQKPGVYFIMAKVSAHLAPSAVFTTNSVCQWYFGYDDTRSGIAYIPIPNCSVYTTHTNVNNCADSTLLCCVFTVNSATGTNLVLICKQTTGTTPLVMDGDGVSIAILSAPRATFYEGNASSTLTLNTSTATNVTLGSDRIVQYPFTHTTGQSAVTVANAGIVFLVAKATFNKTSGTDSTCGTVWVLVNGSAVAAAKSMSHNIVASSNKTTVHVSTILSVAAGDTVSVQAQCVNGTNLTVTSGETGLVLWYVSSTVFTGMQSASFYNDTAQPTAVVSTTPLLTSFASTKSTVPANAITGAGTNLFTVTNGGMYLVTVSVTLSNTSGTVREGGIYLLTSVDQGQTYYNNSGVLSLKQVNANGKTTISACHLMNLPDSSKIKIMTQTNGSTSDNIVVAENCNLSLLCFQKGLPTLSAFNGNHFNCTMAPASITVSSDVYIEKCRLMTDYLASGVYRIGVQLAIEFTTGNASCSVQLLDIVSSNSTTYTVYTKTVNGSNNTGYFYHMDYLNLVEGYHIFLLQVASPANVDIHIEDALLEFWRAV